MSVHSFKVKFTSRGLLSSLSLWPRQCLKQMLPILIVKSFSSFTVELKPGLTLSLGSPIEQAVLRQGACNHVICLLSFW